MTNAKANQLRSQKILGKLKTNSEKRYTEKIEKNKQDKWTIENIWKLYQEVKSNVKRLQVDRSNFEKYLKSRLGDKESHEITMADIDLIKGEMVNKHKLKPATISGVLKLLIRIVNFGKDRKLCLSLDLKIGLPRVNNEKTEMMNSDQLKKYIDAVREEPDKQIADLLELALYTGMRKGELFKLKWEHVDFEKRFILIKDPKGGIDQKIPLNDSALNLLKNHEKNSGSSYVFPGQKRGQESKCYAVANKVKKKAGLPKDFRPFHGLRHAYASMLASSGKVDIQTLQKLLTHKNIKTTMRYAHLSDEVLIRGASVTDDIFNELQDSKPED